MKLKILLSLIICLFLISSNYGQDRPPMRPPDKDMPSPEEMAKKELNDLKDELQLTDIQIPKVQQIIENSCSEMRKLMQSNPESRDMTEIDKIMDKKDENLKLVLTDEQITKYNDFKKKKKKQFKPDGDMPPRNR